MTVTDQELGAALRILFQAASEHVACTFTPLPASSVPSSGDEMERPWMLLPEVIAYARAGRTEVLTALNDGSLHGHQSKPGGRWRVHRDDVDTWLRGDRP